MTQVASPKLGLETEQKATKLKVWSSKVVAFIRQGGAGENILPCCSLVWYETKSLCFDFDHSLFYKKTVSSESLWVCYNQLATPNTVKTKFIKANKKNNCDEVWLSGSVVHVLWVRYKNKTKRKNGALAASGCWQGASVTGNTGQVFPVN